jgi:hypothetical protein
MRIGRGGNVKLTERRTADDFALAMRDLVDLHFPNSALTKSPLVDSV